MIRLACFFLIGSLGVVFVGAIAVTLGAEHAACDIALLIVIYLTIVARPSLPNRYLSRKQVTVVTRLSLKVTAVALMLGYLGDVLSPGMRGVGAFCLGVTQLLARSCTTILLISSPASKILLTFSFSVFRSLVTMAFLFLMGLSPSSQIISALVLQAALTGLVAPIAFNILARLDHAIIKIISAISLSRGDMSR